MVNRESDKKINESEQQRFDVHINQDVCDYIESLYYELESRKTIMGFMLSSGMSLDTESAKKYQEEYRSFFTQYDLAKKELEEQHMPQELRGHRNVWNLDFKTKIMTFIKKCNC